MFTWTERPYATMWAHLRVLSQVHNAKRLLQNQLGGARTVPAPTGGLLDEKASQLSYCVLQANEYFHAADSVSINTSPLLLFYGMLSLAKALIVANDPTKRLQDVKFHGLSHDKTQRADTVENQLVFVNGGVFDDLTQVTSGFRFAKRSAFRFQDVLAVSPELSGMYQRHFQSSPRWVRFYSEQELSHVPFRTRMCLSAKDEQEVLAALPEIAQDFTLQPGLEYGQAICFVSKPELEQPADYFKVSVPVIGWSARLEMCQWLRENWTRRAYGTRQEVPA